MSDNNLSNNFNVSQQALAIQKQREEQTKQMLDAKRQQQETKRQEQVNKIKDDKSRLYIVRQMAERDKSITDKLEALQKDQAEKINAIITKEINKQGNPVLSMLKGMGKSPQAITAEVQNKLGDKHKVESQSYVRGLYDAVNDNIDKQIDNAKQAEKAVELKREFAVKNRLPEDTFEKKTIDYADKNTLKDDYDKTRDMSEGKTVADLRKPPSKDKSVGKSRGRKI